MRILHIGSGFRPFRRGGPGRWAAVAIALAAVLVVLDWLRRLPYMLGLA